MTIQEKDYDPALAQGAATTATLPQTITSAGSNALAVGPSGATNPIFNIDASASSAVVGLNLLGKATGTAAILQVQGTGTNESLQIKPKADGNVTIFGQAGNVISGSGATVTLTAGQSGSICMFDRAAGIVYTLPAPVVGMYFEFVASVTVTSNSYKVITNTGTVLLAGLVASGLDNTANKQWVGNGTTHIALTQAAASTNATGGILGSLVTFTCVTSTLWAVSGTIVAGGTPTTPFATS